MAGLFPAVKTLTPDDQITGTIKGSGGGNPVSLERGQSGDDFKNGPRRVLALHPPIHHRRQGVDQISPHFLSAFIRSEQIRIKRRRSEERRVGKECRSRWSP